LLGKGVPYKNVICLGHINDAFGKKMSKSKGNMVDPWAVINKWGADALRFHLYTINQPGESKNFDIKDVETVVKKNFMILFNVVSFYQMYVDAGQKLKIKNQKSENVLDEWVSARLNQLIVGVTENLESYNIFAAGRSITDFINDLSTWYLRRSRDRFKSDDEPDKQAAISTLGYVLLTLSKLMAPFTPFIADELYQRLGGDKESVHLEDWPADQKMEKSENEKIIILAEMETVRKIVELALAKRDEAGIKVRQPLNKLKVKARSLKLENQYLELINDEVNIKSVEIEESQNDVLEVSLDLKITDELKAEGLLRELIRTINQLRKEAKLTINDRVEIYFQTDSALVKKVVSDYQAELLKSTISKSISEQKFAKTIIDKKIEINGEKIWLAVVK